jgi:hypothetical protein
MSDGATLKLIRQLANRYLDLVKSELTSFLEAVITG